MATQRFLPRVFKRFGETATSPANWESFWEELDKHFPSLSEETSNLSIFEDKGSLFVKAQMPGLEAKNIDLRFENGTLWIRGQGQAETEGKEEEVCWYQRSNSSFSFCVNLPVQIDESKEPNATYENGILTVCFQKAKENQIRKINIK